jgi:hypothetical protein
MPYVREMMHLLDGLAADSAAGMALERLLGRPYWRRLWVLQEAVLGQKVLVICGKRQVPFQSLVHAQSAWQKLFKWSLVEGLEKGGFILTLMAKCGWKAMIETREQYAHYYTDSLKRPPPILDLLRSCRGLKSTDPRD